MAHSTSAAPAAPGIPGPIADMLAERVPDDALCNRILAANPARLCGSRS